VDVQFENYMSVIEWRPRLGFGVSLEVAGYGEGPEMVSHLRLKLLIISPLS